jgi:hypothetical protein
MASIEDQFDLGLETTRSMIETSLAPWGGAAACLDACEATIRTATDAQFLLALILDAGPARSIVATCAELTRDLGALALSRAHWILDA